MRLTPDELNTLRGMYDKYLPVCRSLADCSDCPMDYIIKGGEHCLENWCLLASIEQVLDKHMNGEDSLS